MTRNKHGHKDYPKEYRCWASIKQWCFNENSDRYRYCGALGIGMYEPWIESFDQFLEDIGSAPSLQHTLRRKNLSRDYEPQNMRWVCPEEVSILEQEDYDHQQYQATFTSAPITQSRNGGISIGVKHQDLLERCGVSRADVLCLGIEYKVDDILNLIEELHQEEGATHLYIDLYNLLQQHIQSKPRRQG